MKFVLNGQALPTFLQDQLMQALQARAFVLPCPGFYVFEEVERNEDVQALLPLCFQEKFNWAFVKPNQTFGHFQLIAFDMDSTLINVECIDELADYAGKKEEVARITQRAMQGELDYASSLKLRLLCLKGLDARVLSQVYQQRVRLQSGVESLLKMVHENQMHSIILSGGFTYFTERLRIEYGFDFATSNKLAIEGGRLTGEVQGEMIDANQKRFYFEQYLTQRHIPFEKAIAVGDGANDLPMMQAAGLSVAFHAKESVRYQTDVAIHVGGHDLLPKMLAYA